MRAKERLCQRGLSTRPPRRIRSPTKPRQAELASLSDSRLLLGHAMERAESEDQIAARNARHFTVRKQTRKCIQRHTIVQVVERGHEHDFVGDVKIRVACGKALAIDR